MLFCLMRFFLSFEGLSPKIKTCRLSLTFFPTIANTQREKQNIPETERSDHLKKQKKWVGGPGDFKKERHKNSSSTVIGLVLFFFFNFGFFFFFLKFILQRFHLVPASEVFLRARTVYNTPVRDWSTVLIAVGGTVTHEYCQRMGNLAHKNTYFWFCFILKEVCVLIV